MGGFCSVKGRDEQPEIKAQGMSHAATARRPLEPRSARRHSGASSTWRTALDQGIDDEETYYSAREKLLSEERERAFDAAVRNANDIEQQAADIIKKLRIYDWEKTFSAESNASSTGKRVEERHFLGSVDLINQTQLIRVAKKMPKGSHLHIHFNSCLPAEFLIRQARDVDAMYIRSSLPLISSENMAQSRISFMVMTLGEATHPNGSESFHTQFSYRKEDGSVLQGTVAAEEWLVSKMHISEQEVHHTLHNGLDIWENFSYRTQMMKGLFAYESAYRNYTRACIEDFIKDNIQYAEIRPNFMASNSLKSDDGTRIIKNEGIMAIIQEELTKTKAKLRSEGKYFGGMKVIYCAPRSFHSGEVKAALDECIELKQKYPDLLCGFDLVGHEEKGNELRHFVPEFLDFRKKCDSLNLDVPFLFHCGETLQVGGKIDGNLYDAILLKSKRIGHGYALARHPLLMEIFKEKNIAVESCPISNEVLGLTSSGAGHNLPILLANNVPVCINSDNATYYRSSLSHDFYQVMVSSEAMTLLGWKQLAKWSLEHSCMTHEELEDVTAQWERSWVIMGDWTASAATRKALRLA
ncbi:hypothetical protein B0O99DRAFT_610663 [Bisporella sp. PMI_857]|nr:hypothetical protein B0O99DRAFT_610663 [Bisporella sp. PMI_857]